MPQFKPSILFSDAFGSAGDITYYHRNGKCFTRKKARPVFTGTPSQLSALDVHRRALAAWRTLGHAVQLQWNSLADQVISHQPPFDNTARISGQTLFVSAYHGFATLGNEKMPTPLPFEPFPPFSVEISGATRQDDGVRLFFCVTIANPTSRYRLLAKVYLTEPGKGKNPGLLRNYLCVGDLSGTTVSAIVNKDNPKGNAIQVHARFILLDTVTGYRSQYQEKSFLVNLE